MQIRRRKIIYKVTLFNSSYFIVLQIIDEEQLILQVKEVTIPIWTFYISLLLSKLAFNEMNNNNFTSEY